MSEKTNSKTLDRLAADVRSCRICVEKPEKSALPHEPRPVLQVSGTARLCVCGQAPGTRVHQSGRPFTDPSGDRLRNWMGIDEDIFYDAGKLAIVPMGFCFPGLDAKGGDLPPRTECRKAWHDRLFAAMPQIELVLVIGQYAQAYHLGSNRQKSLTETVSNWRQHFARQMDGKPAVLPLPHPSWRNNAWLRKNPWFETELLPVLRGEVQRLTMVP
ncbi:MULTISPECIES: uracil-DNA glycosylase family protein [Stappiaceae]|uniref:uracil-DNA glycosylase family protein n=1 Tax=Stappiaceae TaxID=2821832 RepID=UPI0006E41A9E|nr:MULTISPECIES: uracil-DNA glycosylase family protein [Stappiaceae]MEC9472291.1 uracil-DNA glycosylase family protein [Pseudomonadota bacterium]NKX67175.1 uracil-DNA glycosylase family protein [Labrenzia sp. 5N]WJS00901.1 uracil-DNA glycosylase family protein [Roseibium aggregatum]